MPGPRKRVPADVPQSQPVVSGESEQRLRATQHQFMTDKFWLATISACLMLFVLYDINYHTFPQPAADTAATDSSFIEGNARQFVEEVCKHGTRHLGSHTNEVVVVEEIIKRVNDIKQSCNAAHKVELEIQTPSGCYSRGKLDTYCYTHVKNILVKLSPSSTVTSSAVLINCHHDTAISSPGASDDMVSCAIMMETLRILSLTKTPFKHSILFIFNGAEETGLQASHGFITQHRWAKEVKAFVNLEAAGAGGREMVFQAGPENPWLIAAYSQSVKYPFASVIGQEIFQSGVIPSDTDFRIFRDYGHISGIDIAYAYNGYVYHTKYDLPEYIPAGCIQRGGENLLSLLTTLGNSDKLEDPGDSRLGKMVFFDVLGLFMVLYPLKIGEIINALVVVAVLLNLYRKVKAFRQSGGTSSLYIKLIAASFSMHGIGFLLIVSCDIALALVINSIRPMMWYTNSWLIFPVYILPAIAVWILVHQRGCSCFKGIFQLVSMWDLEVIYFEAGLLFWTISLAVLTICGVASAYICMLLVVFPLIIRQFVVDLFNIKLISSPKLYLTLSAAALFCPVLHLLQAVHALNSLFIPLTGRMGTVMPPELTVCFISIIPVVVISTYLAGFLHVTKDLTALVVKLVLISAIFVLAGCFSSLGFPYSADPLSPSAQRHILNHYWREFYAYDGRLEREDHGLLYLPFDYNGLRYLDNIDEIKSMKLQKFDEDFAYGGFPYYYSKIYLLRKLYTNELSKPSIKKRISISHTTEKLAKDIVRHHFTSSGEQAHGHIYMSVKNGSKLIAWSFTSGVPIPSKMPAEVPEDSSTGRHWLDIAFAAHYLDGEDSTTPQLSSVLSKFPNWTVPLGWVATLQHYRF